MVVRVSAIFSEAAVRGELMPQFERRRRRSTSHRHAQRLDHVLDGDGLCVTLHGQLPPGKFGGQLVLVVVDLLAAGGIPDGQDRLAAGVERGQRRPGAGMANYDVRLGERGAQLSRR